MRTFLTTTDHYQFLTERQICQNAISFSSVILPWLELRHNRTEGDKHSTRRCRCILPLPWCVDWFFQLFIAIRFPLTLVDSGSNIPCSLGSIVIEIVLATKDLLRLKQPEAYGRLTITIIWTPTCKHQPGKSSNQQQDRHLWNPATDNKQPMADWIQLALNTTVPLFTPSLWQYT